MAGLVDVGISAMTPEQTAVSQHASALRRIWSGEIRSSGRVKKSAFLPRKDGQDRDGFSVSIESAEHSRLHRELFETHGHRACQIRVAAIRELDPLDVIHAPEQNDPMHALIIGMPDRTNGPDELAKVEYLADELAKRAAPYTFK